MRSPITTSTRRLATQRGLRIKFDHATRRYALHVDPDSGVRVNGLDHLRQQLATTDQAHLAERLHNLTAAEVVDAINAPADVPLNYRCTYRRRT